jgi:hypothetical protein
MHQHPFKKQIGYVKSEIKPYFLFLFLFYILYLYYGTAYICFYIHITYNKHYLYETKIEDIEIHIMMYHL